MDDKLYELVELIAKRTKKKWDNLIIIDGMERSGKSTLAKTIAHAYSHKMEIPFSMENVFFEPDKLMDFAINNNRSVIIWDEAALGGLSFQWQNKTQQKLNQMLMIAGKYEHFYIFIIPSFFRLNKYLAIDRSLGLIHVFTPDLIKRGMFCSYSRSNKAWIYNNNSRSEMYGKSLAFRGRFTVKNTQNILNEAAYEAKKDEAINKFAKNTGAKGEDSLRDLKKRLIEALGPKKVAEITGFNYNSVQKWKYLLNNKE